MESQYLDGYNVLNIGKTFFLNEALDEYILIISTKVTYSADVPVATKGLYIVQIYQLPDLTTQIEYNSSNAQNSLIYRHPQLPQETMTSCL